MSRERYLQRRRTKGNTHLRSTTLMIELSKQMDSQHLDWPFEDYQNLSPNRLHNAISSGKHFSV
jgi:hypothetical protein